MGKTQLRVCPHAPRRRLSICDASVVAEGNRFNSPMILVPGLAPARSFASVDSPNLVLDTIKKAEDSGRGPSCLYESHGGRGIAKVRWDLPFKSAVLCNGLEEEIGKAKTVNGLIEVPFGPFQIVTVKVV